MATEHTRPLLLSLIMMTALSLVPMLSHAAVFWDDEMEAGSPFEAPYAIGIGAMAYDTNVKMSGAGSLRLEYPTQCEPLALGNVGCGGGAGREIPPTDNLYRRIYFRMSGQGPIVTPSRLFETSVKTFTKMLRATSDGINKEWWMMGCCGSKRFLLTQENTPPGGATNVFTNFTLTDNRWYCLETHDKLGTPGVANGIAEAWVDGVNVLTKSDILNRQAGNNNLWNRVEVFRQTGRGNIWWDRFATGNTRIGCLGATPASDTTPPAPPQGLVIR